MILVSEEQFRHACNIHATLKRPSTNTKSYDAFSWNAKDEYRGHCFWQLLSIGYPHSPVVPMLINNGFIRLVCTAYLIEGIFVWWFLFLWPSKYCYRNQIPGSFEIALVLFVIKPVLFLSSSLKLNLYYNVCFSLLWANAIIKSIKLSLLLFIKPNFSHIRLMYRSMLRGCTSRSWATVSRGMPKAVR